MKSQNIGYILQALLAAVFFGASAPVSKLLLGDIAPVFLASFLYLGSGTGIALTRLTQRKGTEAGIQRADVKWLAGAILSGGILAPILLMVSLQHTPASTASLLLNFEGVGTTVIALFFFRESISRRAWTAILLITLASIFLSTDFSSGFGVSPGALGILLACVLWGADNNFTRNISGKDPLVIVAWKGLAAGSFSFLLAWALGSPFPSATAILSTMALGFLSYGLSTLLFIRSMRGLGAARTSALYGTAPLAGVLLSIVIFGEIPSVLFAAAALLMIGGALLLVNESHSHTHIHTAIIHEHSHSHRDPMHEHDEAKGIHSHVHEHPVEEHEHDHMPDIHHRHGHEKERRKNHH
ncbi:MAG: EamA/RhaT family transporter [Chloroflexi bacterium]|nr:EamA/RhaT family transporter [Chloroflexota bacterium]MDL1944068.1 DMT family transporter [Chloroflexi bacterium CFX2]